MWGYTVIDWVKDGDIVIGVNLVCDNGDAQYMTMEEYANFTKNRDVKTDCTNEKEG